MERIQLIGTVLSSGVLTFILSKVFGKKKYDIEVALKYQEYYQKHIDDLKREIEELKAIVEDISRQNKELLKKTQ